MAGHSKWANIKHRKGKQDAARGKTFTKLIREITVAAREGGGDESNNSRLRSAVLTAKSENMPAANIDRAIKKGIGELDGESYEAAIYEGYGPGGVAMFVDALTDNKNRTVGEVRHAFSKHGGNLGESGCVGYMFDQKGSILIDPITIDEEKLMDMALDAGAEDVLEEENEFQVLTAPDDFNTVREKLEENDVAFIEASLAMIPQNSIEITEEKVAIRLMKLMDVLEDCDDVQDVHANFDISDDIMEKIS